MAEALRAILSHMSNALSTSNQVRIGILLTFTYDDLTGLKKIILPRKVTLYMAFLRRRETSLPLAAQAPLQAARRAKMPTRTHGSELSVRMYAC